MCLAVYLGCSEILPEIEWNGKSPAFNVKEDGDSNPGLRKRLGTKYLYYLGSHEGCGCGFSLDGHGKEEDDWSIRKKNYEDLGRYLKTNRVGEKVRIFVCWEGDQEKEPNQKSDLRIAEIQNGEMEFQELTEYKIGKDEN